MTDLLSRIASETGVAIRGEDDHYKLAGAFNRYRPHADGLERLLSDCDVEGEVLRRLKRVFEVTAPSWQEDDLYFVVRTAPDLSPSGSLSLGAAYVRGVRDLLRACGQHKLAMRLSTNRVSIGFAAADVDAEATIYDCLNDRLDTLPTHPLLALHEALYSMANDYWLVAFVLKPLSEHAFGDAADAYFDLWRHKLQVKFAADGAAYVIGT